jgi:hypothetical protein
MTTPSVGLVCHLRHKTQGRSARSPLAGEVELENTSSEVLEIPVKIAPLQYLNLSVSNAEGRVISEGHHGDRFSPVEQPYIWRLAPGETYRANVSLLGTVAPEKQQPGSHTIRAVYEVGTLCAVSAPLLLHLPNEGA